MKRVSFCLAVACMFSLVTAVQAQRTQVCVIDVAKVFQNYSRFTQQLDGLRGEAEQFRVYLQGKAAELQKMAEDLQRMEVNSPAFQQLESQLAESQARLEVERRAKTREFVQREAKLHFESYVATTEAVATICQQRGTHLVLQMSSAPMDVDEPQSVMQRVNSDIVYHAPQRDITNDVIALLNGREPERVGNLPAGSSNR